MKEDRRWNAAAFSGIRPCPWLYPGVNQMSPYGYQSGYWNLWNYTGQMNPGRTEDELDAARLQELYPIMARHLQPYVEETCSQLEYPGSMMYDEYQDRLSLLHHAKNIWDSAQKNEDFGENSPEWEQMQDLIGVLLLQEMLRRRSRKRNRFDRRAY